MAFYDLNSPSDLVRLEGIRSWSGACYTLRHPTMKIGVITNPRSRKNRGRPNRAAELQRIVGDVGEVHATTAVADIKPILRDFLRRRAQYWVADGGDGALHWMVRAGL